jgi:hypothetical protein
MNAKAIDTIKRIGAIIVGVLTSIALPPPLLSPNESGAINWSNLLSFVAGVLGIIIYAKFKDRNLRKFSVLLLLGLLVLFLLYEILYQKYSVVCFQSQRVVISYQPVKKEIAEEWSYWLKHSDTRKFIIEAHRCSSTEVWNFSDLAIQYYGMISLYLLMITLLVMLIVSLTDLIV